MADRTRIAPTGLARMLLKYAKIRREDRGKYYARVNQCAPPFPRLVISAGRLADGPVLAGRLAPTRRA
jgi:hypothetical protein